MSKSNELIEKLKTGISAADAKAEYKYFHSMLYAIKKKGIQVEKIDGVFKITGECDVQAPKAKKSKSRKSTKMADLPSVKEQIPKKIVVSDFDLKVQNEIIGSVHVEEGKIEIESSRKLGPITEIAIKHCAKIHARNSWMDATVLASGVELHPKAA